MGRQHTAAGTQTMYKVESSYGNASGTAQWFGFVQEHTPDENPNVQAVRYCGGGDRNVDTFIDGPNEYRNSIPMIMQTGKFLAAAFGKVQSASGAQYTHTITESGTLPSFTTEEALESVTNEHAIRTYAGCKVDSLTLEGTMGQAIMMTVDYVAQSSVQGSGTKTVVTADTDKPFLWSMVKLEVSGSTINGALNELRDWTWRISNGLDPDNYMDNTANIADPEPLERDYEFSMDLGMMYGTGGDIYDKFFRAGSEANFNLWFFRASGTDHLQLWMSGCKTLDCDLPQPHMGKVIQKWVTQPTSCGAIVKHGTAAYAFSTV